MGVVYLYSESLMFLRDRHSRITASLLMFAVGIGVMIYFAEELLNLGGQLYLGWGSFFIIFLMSKIKYFRNQPWRSLFIVLALFVSCRYMAWRIFDTLIYTGFLDFIGTALLFLAELYGFTLFLLDMFVNFSPMSSEVIPLSEDEASYPSVDVFIPTYDESETIVRMTVTAATQIQYPKEKLNIYILDDGGTHAKRRSRETGHQAWRRHYNLRKLAKELGVQYITRDTNQKAKAGNINHALQHSNGDLILILDCDQIPTKDILHNTGITVLGLTVDISNAAMVDDLGRPITASQLMLGQFLKLNLVSNQAPLVATMLETLPATNEVEVRVFDPNGKPISDSARDLRAVVTVTSKGKVKRMRASGTGTFRLASLPNGQVRVVVTRVQKGKISSAAVAFPVKGNVKKTVTIQLKKVN